MLYIKINIQKDNLWNLQICNYSEWTSKSQRQHFGNEVYFTGILLH
jgi:hypothetical protein